MGDVDACQASAIVDVAASVLVINRANPGTRTPLPIQFLYGPN